MSSTTFIPSNLISDMISGSAKSNAHLFWSAIGDLWNSHWLAILIFLILWVIYEILTRHGSVHYNSRNGYSPTLNRVVGSGTYILFQAILYGIFHIIFGNQVYQSPWPWIVHAIVFPLTKLFLLWIGFWVY